MNLNSEFDRSMAALEAAAAAARLDPDRPVFHFAPPAQSMNDVNGPLLWKGWHHIFYQLNPVFPFQRTDGHWCYRMHWGHARSRDLVRWEHLPIALCPNPEEEHCASGGAIVNDEGTPMVFYTSMYRHDPFQQWAAVPEDDDLIRWKKLPSNPVLGYRTQGEEEFHREWRDPFLFRHDQRIFMLVGATTKGLPIYEAARPDLSAWTYRGYLYPRSAECPNFVRLGDRWVLFTSAFDRGVVYWVGAFDPERLAFEPGPTEGAVDQTRGFNAIYGTNILQDAKGRPILLGRILAWEKGFYPGQKAWNGCMALPRVLSLDGDQLIQAPLPELDALHAAHAEKRNLALADEEIAVADFGTNTVEVRVRFATEGAQRFGVRLGCGADGSGAATIEYRAADKLLSVAGSEFPLSRPPAGGGLDLQVFLDRTLLEVFVNGGRETASRVVYPAASATGISVFAQGGKARVQSLDAWRMKPMN